MKRIAYIIHDASPWILSEIEAIMKKGTDVLVCATNPEARFPDSFWNECATPAKLVRTNVLALLRYRLSYLLAAWRIARKIGWQLFFRLFYFASVIRMSDITSIHAHFATTATLMAETISRLEKIPYSFCAHAYDIFKHDVDHEDLRRKIRNANFVRTVSKFHKNFLLSIDSSIPTDKIKIISYAVDENKFFPIEKERHSKFLILSVGNLVLKKGFPALIEACEILKQDNIDFECWIVGSGPMQESLEKQIDLANLKRYVKLRGSQAHENLNELYNLADVFVLPSIRTDDGDMDGIPNVLIEAMAAECPVISTYIAGIPELIDHEINGLLVSPEKSSLLADAIERICKNHEFAAAIAFNGRMKVLNNYRADDVAEKLLKLL